MHWHCLNCCSLILCTTKFYFYFLTISGLPYSKNGILPPLLEEARMKLIQLFNYHFLKRSFLVWGGVGTNQSPHWLIEGGFSHAALLEGREDQKDLREVSIFIMSKCCSHILTELNCSGVRSYWLIYFLFFLKKKVSVHPILL